MGVLRTGRIDHRDDTERDTTITQAIDTAQNPSEGPAPQTVHALLAHLVRTVDADSQLDAELLLSGVLTVFP